jgi:hypothetical protein
LYPNVIPRPLLLPGLFVLGLACMTREVRDDAAATDSGHADATGAAGDVPPPPGEDLGEACAVPGDCMSGLCMHGVCCRSYYRDQDGDGYGAESPQTIELCEATPAAPDGFTARGGDCCDTDPVANPGLAAATYFEARDGCGSFDWDCRNGEEKQATGICPSTGASLRCGQPCILVFKGVASTLFVQACH